MYIKEINVKLKTLKNKINTININPAISQPVFQQIDDELNKLLNIKRFNVEKKYISNTSQEEYIYSFTPPVMYKNDSQKTCLLQVVIHLKEERIIRNIYVPQQTIYIEDCILEKYPDLYQFQNTIINDDFDITYFLRVLDSIYCEYESKKILQYKDLLLLYSYKTITNSSEEKEIINSLNWYITSYISNLTSLLSNPKLPSSKTLLDEIFSINLNKDLELVSIEIIASNYSRKMEITTSQKSRIFSSMLKDAINLMQEDFYKVPHYPACGKAKIIIKINNLYTNDEIVKYISFRY